MSENPELRKAEATARLLETYILDNESLFGASRDKVVSVTTKVQELKGGKVKITVALYQEDPDG